MKKILSFVLTIAIFLLVTQCKKDCDQSSRCKLEPDAGSCLAAIPKYYFDQKENKCKEFTWGGCGGVVPFDTKEECEKQCGCE